MTVLKKIDQAATVLFCVCTLFVVLEGLTVAIWLALSHPDQPQPLAKWWPLVDLGCVISSFSASWIAITEIRRRRKEWE